jgi:quercetin dioxygenase-like cupin family protein
MQASKVSIAGFAIAALLAGMPALAQDSKARQELRRADLSGAPGMEVVLSVSEYKPGDSLNMHFHHGVEAGYVLEGGKVQVPGKDATDLPTGNSIMNLRDVNHGGWKNVGTSTIKLITVHVVDKGKPLYDESKK